MKLLLLLLFSYLLIIWSSANKNLKRLKSQNTPKGLMGWNNSTVLFDCHENSHTMVNNIFIPLNNTIFVKDIFFHNCLLPPMPVLDTLKELNINATNLVELTFDDIMLPSANFTKGLNFVTSLTLEDMKTDVIDNEFFGHLIKLNSVSLLRNTLMSLPPITHLYRLKVYNSSVTNWDDCQFLEILMFINVKSIQLNLTLNCPNLRILVIKSVSAVSQLVLLNGTRLSWENLTVLGIFLAEIPELPFEVLSVAKNLKQLSLAGSNITDASLTNFTLLPRLINLNLEDNKIRGFSLPKLMMQVPRLRHLVLDNNKKLKCRGPMPILNMSAFSEHASSLSRLSLVNTKIEMSCFQNVSFPNLKMLNLSRRFRGFVMEQTYYRIQDFPKTTSARLTVDLNKQQAKFMFGYTDYLSLSQTGSFATSWGSNTTLTILMGKIICPCSFYWLIRALLEFPDIISMPDLRCLYMSPLKSFMYKYCEDTEINLTYELSVKNWTNGVILEVHESTGNIWDKLAKLHYRIDTLNVSGNKNVSFFGSDIPRKIQDIDLRNIGLSLGEKEMSILFSISERRVWLSGNIFICDCDHRTQFDILRRHQDQIMDFTELICFGSNSTLYLTSLEICSLRYPLAFGGTTLIFIIILALFLYIYRMEVKIYLYNHGWCIYCLREEDIDSDRPYDAFLSFAHDDDEYVMTNLLPKLEIEPNSYRICMHYRDWAIGDWIPRQVSRSVRLSKRTIIVLSRNFVDSLWGYLEFRYAVADEDQGGRSRLIILILDDVLDQPLSEELQGYLAMNTYLHCKDSWFWQKLIYAMPRNKSISTSKTSDENRAATPEPPLDILMEVFPNR